MNNKITVLIPTFNRKEDLTRTLNILMKQTNQHFNILISDNDSNYNLTEIISELPDYFTEKIVIEKNACNVGMDINIGFLFMKCKTEWAWLLADDDLPNINAIDVIHQNIDKYSDVGWIDFPVYNTKRITYDKLIIPNLKYFINYLDRIKKAKIEVTNSNIIFVSNKVYNMKHVNKVLPKFFQYSYTYISAAVLQIILLNEGFQGLIVPSKIVDHNCKTNYSWNPEKACLCSRTFVDIDLNLSIIEKKKLYSFIVFSPGFIIRSHFKQDYVHRNNLFLSVVYNGIYKYCLPFKFKCLFIIFIQLDKFRLTNDFVKHIFKWKDKIRSGGIK